MTTPQELRRRAERQRKRRMTQRVCGNCGERADAMVDWGRQRIPICHACRGRLTGDMPDWSLVGHGQGPRCPIDTTRPCDDCVKEGDPAAEAGQRQTAHGSFRFWRRH